MAAGRESSELLFVNNPCAFADYDKLVGGDVRNGLEVAVGPADGQMGHGLRAKAEVQAPIVDRVEARLGEHLLGVKPASIVRSHARADGTSIGFHSDEQHFEPVTAPRNVVAQ